MRLESDELFIVHFYHVNQNSFGTYIYSTGKYARSGSLIAAFDFYDVINNFS